VEDTDIEPGHVIAHDQGWRMPRGWRAAYCELQVNDTQRLARPALDDPPAPLVGEKWKNSCHTNATVGDVKQQSSQPVDPSKARV